MSILRAIRRQRLVDRAYVNGYEQGRFDEAMEPHCATCSPPAGPATASENGMNRPTYADGPAGGDGNGRGTA